MKRFQFSLERVERWRAIQAQIQKTRAQQAAALLGAARSECEKHASGIRDSERHVAAGGEAILMAAYPGYRERCVKESKALFATAQKLEQVASNEMRRLTEMDRAHRLLEKLHEARKMAWEDESRREEDVFAGEAFLARVQSRNRGA